MNIIIELVKYLKNKKVKFKICNFDDDYFYIKIENNDKESIYWIVSRKIIGHQIYINKYKENSVKQKVYHQFTFNIEYADVEPVDFSSSDTENLFKIKMEKFNGK
jgi:tRNA G10  N-methylase Trm11